MPFADDFLRHVKPRLERVIRLQGLFICVGSATWEEGYYEVLHLAAQRGALRLDQEHFERLRDWIGRALLASIERVEPEWEAAQRASDAAWKGSRRTRRALSEIAAHG
jgi:hypothetical protein